MNHIKLTGIVHVKRRSSPFAARRLLVALCLCAGVVLSGCRAEPEAPARRGKVRVAAAADLNAAFPDLIMRFGASHDVDVSVSYGSSGNFYAQLINEAPFDMFLSADVSYPNQLAARGLTLPQSEFTYAIGRIVVWAPASSTLDVEHEGLQVLTQASIKHVAIANPEHAPYGRAARQLLMHAGLWGRIESRLVLGENVSQAAQFVASGAAQAGIIAYSLTRAPALAERGTAVVLPAATHEPLLQKMVLLKGAGATARAFRDFLDAPTARALFERYGFQQSP